MEGSKGGRGNLNPEDTCPQHAHNFTNLSGAALAGVWPRSWRRGCGLATDSGALRVASTEIMRGSMHL